MRSRFTYIIIILSLTQSHLAFSQTFEWGLDGYSEHSQGGVYKNIHNSGIDIHVKGLYNDDCHFGYKNVRTGINNQSKGSIVHEYQITFSEKVDVTFSLFDLNHDTLKMCFVDHVHFSGHPIFSNPKGVTINGNSISPFVEDGGNVTIKYHQVDTIIILHGRKESCNPGYIGITPLIINKNSPFIDTTSFENILFDIDKSTVKPEYFQRLDSLTDYIVKNPLTEILLYGYTDKMGDATYNYNLSKKRVTAVFNYLMSKGISSKQISIKSFGEESPVKNNSTQLGRKKNRRVEIILLTAKAQ